jgi:ATP:corrinoid adenosyltransferase
MTTTGADHQPLWLAMHNAGMNAPGTPIDAIAAEIEALRDWLELHFEDKWIYNCLTEQALQASYAAQDELERPAARPVTLQLTADQQAAIEGILQDIAKPNATPVLCGYAGTGKTVTTAALVSRLAGIGKRVVVATPTHKARSQVERALANCGAEGFEAVTVARLLGLKQVRDRQTGKETFKPDSAGKNMLSKTEEWDDEEKEMVKIRRIDIVVVDETSMLSSELYDLLLRELEGRPVVFVGDDRQLLPVKETEVCKAFTNGSSLYDSVNMINTRIHQRRYGVDAPQFVEGMTCVTVDAIPDPMGAAPLLNSTVDVLIQEAIREPHRFVGTGDLLTDEPWDTWELSVTGDFAMAKTFRVIAAEDEQRWQKWLKDLADEAREASGQKRSELWDLFFRRKDCVGKLQPASALTVHKSQGSTFQHVFLHWDIDGRGSQPTAVQNQLSYVGITRAAESLHVVGDR